MTTVEAFEDAGGVLHNDKAPLWEPGRRFFSSSFFWIGNCLDFPLLGGATKKCPAYDVNHVATPRINMALGPYLPPKRRLAYTPSLPDLSSGAKMSCLVSKRLNVLGQ